MPENNLKQARVPRGRRSSCRTRSARRPGYRVEIGPPEDRRHLVVLPGRAARDEADARPRPCCRGSPSCTAAATRRSSHVPNLRHQRVRARRDHRRRSPGEGRWSFRANFPEVSVRVVVRGAGRRRAARGVRPRGARAARPVHLRRGRHEHGARGRRAARASAATTVAFAESCTGGLVAHRLTNVPGSSAYFRGGINAYANEVKERLLGVPAATARGPRRGQRRGRGGDGARVRGARSASDLAVGVTGIAGPDGGTAEKPVGTVCFGLAAADQPTVTRRYQLWGNREWVKLLVVADRARLGAPPPARRCPLLEIGRRGAVPAELEAGECRARVSRAARRGALARASSPSTLGDPARRGRRSSTSERLRADGRAGSRWTRPENLHLTLKFLGDVATRARPEPDGARCDARSRRERAVRDARRAASARFRAWRGRGCSGSASRAPRVAGARGGRRRGVRARRLRAERASVPPARHARTGPRSASRRDLPLLARDGGREFGTSPVGDSCSSRASWQRGARDTPARHAAARRPERFLDRDVDSPNLRLGRMGSSSGRQRVAGQLLVARAFGVRHRRSGKTQRSSRRRRALQREVKGRGMATMASEANRDRAATSNRDRAIDLAVSQIEKQFGKGAIMKLGEDALIRDVADHLDRLARPRHRARRRRLAARPRRRDLRSGVVGQDDARAARHRAGAEARAASAPSSTPSTRSTSPTRRKLGVQHRRPAHLAARQRRAGARDRRDAGAQRRHRRAGRRLGRGARAARRDRRRHGRSADGPAGAAHVAGAAQAHRHHRQVATPSSSSSTRSA